MAVSAVPFGLSISHIEVIFCTLLLYNNACSKDRGANSQTAYRSGHSDSDSLFLISALPNDHSCNMLMKGFLFSHANTTTNKSILSIIEIEFPLYQFPVYVCIILGNSRPASG